MGLESKHTESPSKFKIKINSLPTRLSGTPENLGAYSALTL